MYYSGGIYSSAAHQRAEWEPVDHAVLLVGYGSENGRDLAAGEGSLGKWLESHGKRWKMMETMVGKWLEHGWKMRGRGSKARTCRIGPKRVAVFFQSWCPLKVLGC